MSHAAMTNLAESVAANQRARARRRRSVASSGLWYVLLTAIAVLGAASEGGHRHGLLLGPRRQGLLRGGAVDWREH